MNHSIIAQLRVKKPTDSFGTIVIRGFFNRKPVASRSTGHRILKQHWNHTTHRVEHNAPNAAMINMLIDKELQQAQANVIHKQLMNSHINKQHIAEAVNGYLAADFISYCKEKIHTDYKKPDTKRSLISQCDKITAFHPDVLFTDINSQWLHRYKKFLEKERNNNPNTIWNSFKFINTMMNKAMKQGGIILQNPMKDFDRGRCEPSGKKPLTIEQCDKIREIADNTFSQPIIRAIAARFLLMVYSGMRWSDAMAFDPDLHVKDGRFIMTYKKWSESVNYKIYDRLAEVIELVKKHPLQITNVAFNRWLKIIGAACGIEQPLSSHIGRHTLGYLLADMNVPKEKAKKILGHKNDRSTDIYYHVTDDQVDRELERAFNK